MRKVLVGPSGRRTENTLEELEVLNSTKENGRYGLPGLEIFQLSSAC